MRRFEITSEEEGIRLIRYVEKKASALTSNGIYRAIRTKHIKVNGKKTAPSYRLSQGDIVEFWLKDDSQIHDDDKLPDFMNAGKEINIIYEDDNLAIVEKPKGLFSHSVKGNYTDNILARYLRYLFEKKEFIPGTSYAPSLCNRLDRNTEGLIIIGKSHIAVETINRMIAEKKIEKTYYAVCTGKLKEEGLHEGYWSKNTKTNQVLITAENRTDSEPVKTSFYIAAVKSGLSLIRVELHTGKTHQIRAHLSMLGSPILGDPKYGNAKANKKYNQMTQLLAAYSFKIKEWPFSEYFEEPSPEI